MVNAPQEIGAIRAHLARGLTLIEKRTPDYIRGREYYDGTRAEVFATAAIEKLLSATAAAAPISLAHIPVDVIIDKVELAAIAAVDETAHDVLSTVLDNNDIEDEGDDWLRKAGYFGDYYAIVDPTEDGINDDDETDTPVATVEGVRVVGSSPLSTVVIYDAQYGRTKEYGVKTWTTGTGTPKERLHAFVYYDDSTVKLVTPIGAKNPTAADFAFDFEEEESEAFIEHEGGRMLIEHLAIDGRPYGVPLHRKAWGPQDAITKISATNLNNVDGQGFASRWALADPMAEIDDDIDDDFGDAGPTAPGAAPADGITAATSGTSRVRSIPGAISILRGIKEVGEFSATDSDNFLKNLDWYVRVMAVATGVAMFEFDMKGEQPSGESRRRAEGRSNKKAAKVKRQAGAFFKNLGDTILAVLGMESEVTATFNPSETSTDKDGLELVGLKIAAGVPISQALLEAGYTDEQVDEWYPDGKPHITPDTLALLATALQQLGQAKTLGVITDDELRGMLPDILTGARGERVPIAAVEPPAA